MCAVQDGQVSLKVMLSSPYLTESHSKVVQWAANYCQIETIVDLWYTCERKVSYCLARACVLCLVRL